MATLVNVTREGRLFLKVGGVIFTLLMVLFIFIKGGSVIQNVFFPKPPPAPLEEFGKLPNIPFPQGSSTTITYTVNTVDGSLPSFPDRINIYKLVTQKPDLLALETAKNTLDSENFVDGQIKVSDTIYRWNQSRTGVTIEYDIVNHNFTLFSNYLTNPNLVSTGLLPSESVIINDTKGFLTTINANVSNLDMQNMKVDYLQEQNGSLVKAENLGLARYAKVTIPQNKIDDIGIVYSNPERSLTSFIVSYPNSSYTIVEGIFYNFEADSEQKSDYPIKTAQQALEQLKSGKAYISNPQNLANVDITNIELDYYLSKDTREYLLPVYVFKGVNFEAYVEALSDSSIESNSSGQVLQN